MFISHNSTQFCKIYTPNCEKKTSQNCDINSQLWEKKSELWDEKKNLYLFYFLFSCGNRLKYTSERNGLLKKKISRAVVILIVHMIFHCTCILKYLSVITSVINLQLPCQPYSYTLAHRPPKPVPNLNHVPPPSQHEVQHEHNKNILPNNYYS